MPLQGWEQNHPVVANWTASSPDTTTSPTPALCLDKDVQRATFVNDVFPRARKQPNAVINQQARFADSTGFHCAERSNKHERNKRSEPNELVRSRFVVDVAILYEAISRTSSQVCSSSKRLARFARSPPRWLRIKIGFVFFRPCTKCRCKGGALLLSKPNSIE